MADDRELLTVKQVAALLQVPPATLHTWRYRGIGPKAMKVGRYLRYRRGDVEEWLDGLAKMSDDRRPVG